ncbi:TetR/AcrR family transcriptional regulator [Serinibacter arcticus]|uniref:Transcriptional regulator, TetR family n=1 Tax=Serinibacter arcticus TaxID=1655435 RepID=A0A4Z1E2C5_9MICO|nr:TetR/AcrR family transcriptional regulator [Serinibacter arcticus]TGO03977.1 Transcriptional regulator, TetR family [Serinibacter arcticus]
MTETGLRERKKTERRDALVARTRAQVLERGLDAVTVEEICAAVGVSPRTFFNYFATKEDAVLGHALDDLRVTAHVRETFVGGGPTGDLLLDATEVLRAVADDPRITSEELDALMALVQREPRLLERHVFWIENQRVELQDLILEREAQHPSGTDARVAATVLMSLFRAAAIAWIEDDRRGHPTDHLTHVVAQLRLLATPTTPTSTGTTKQGARHV